MLILFEPFPGILLLNTRYSSIILFHAFDTLKIPEHRFETKIIWKVICLGLSQAFFLLLCQFHMNMNIQNSWPHWSSTYRWQFSSGNRFREKVSTNLKVTSILPVAIIHLYGMPFKFLTSFNRPIMFLSLLRGFSSTFWLRIQSHGHGLFLNLRLLHANAWSSSNRPPAPSPVPAALHP